VIPAYDANSIRMSGWQCAHSRGARSRSSVAPESCSTRCPATRSQPGRCRVPASSSIVSCSSSQRTTLRLLLGGGE
jgi:hypothetical protein